MIGLAEIDDMMSDDVDPMDSAAERLAASSSPGTAPQRAAPAQKSATSPEPSGACYQAGFGSFAS